VGIAFVILFSLILNGFQRSITEGTNNGIKITLTGIKSSYPANEAIWFTVTARGHGKLCSPLIARIENVDSGNTIASYSYYKNLATCKPGEERDVDETLTLHEMMGDGYFPQLIHLDYGTTGHHRLIVEYGGVKLHEDFVQH
jgi:hypothetical protein